jgi:hypothetical protein
MFSASVRSSGIFYAKNMPGMSLAWHLHLNAAPVPKRDESLGFHANRLVAHQAARAPPSQELESPMSDRAAATGRKCSREGCSRVVAADDEEVEHDGEVYCSEECALAAGCNPFACCGVTDVVSSYARLVA